MANLMGLVNSTATNLPTYSDYWMGLRTVRVKNLGCWMVT
jgi:hypothetical protein